MPQEWEGYLSENVPFYSELTGDTQERFLEYLKIFVWEKHWIEAGGMEITDEVKVTIAASAIRLVLFLDLSHYDDLTEIVVYPGHYKHPEKDDSIIYGEAHDWGVVVLSWDAVLHGLKNPHDGRDTAAHEFAHVLDRAAGRFDGTPELDRFRDYKDWAEVMSYHYLRLKEREKRERKVLDMYGAQNEVEFFAVATESFFEKPTQMEKHTPELFEQLKKFYGWDPIEKKEA